jgi:hypothetical protein
MGWQWYDEAIGMVQRRFGYFPSLFLWRGRAFEVDSIHRCWEVGRRGRRPARRYFRVEAGGATFDLYRNLEAGTWHLRRALWRPASVSAGRVILPTHFVTALSEPTEARSPAGGS